MAIQSLDLVKILSYRKTGFMRVWGTMPHIIENKAWIVLRTPPDTANDTMTLIDFSGATIQELEVDGDWGFKTPLYFHRKKLDGTLEVTRIAGFGQCCAENYPTASIIFKFHDDGSYDKTTNTHTDPIVNNPNNDNNIDKCLYIPEKKKLLCGTGQGGRHIWIIDLETLTWEQYGRILSGLTASYGYHAGVFSGNNRIYFVGGTHITSFISSSNPFIVSSVELDDILENMNNDVGLNELGTYQEIHKDATRGMFDVPASFTTFGKKTIVRTLDANGNSYYTVIDFATGTVEDLSIIPPNGFLSGSFIFRVLGYWALIDNNGIIHILDNDMNEVTTIQIPSWSNYQYQGKAVIGSWLNNNLIGYDNVNKKLDIFAVRVNDKIPKLIVDASNKIVKVVDMVTKSPITSAIVKIAKSRAGNPLDEPIDVSTVTRTTDTNGEIDFSDIVEPNKFIVFQLIDIP